MTFFEEIVEAFQILKKERESAPDWAKQCLFDSVDLDSNDCIPIIEIGNFLRVFDARVSNGRLEVYAMPFNSFGNPTEKREKWFVLNDEQAETLCEDVYELIEENREINDRVGK